MRRILFLLFMMTIQSLTAQNYVHQVLILNEGYFDYQTNQIIEPVTVGAYNPSSQVYSTIDTIHGARFASDIIVDESCFYVAADNTLYKYDKDTYGLIATQQIPGVRNLAIYQDKILVSRGEYLTTYNSYLQIYSKIDLSFITEFDTIIGPKWATQNMIVDGDLVYVTINNGFEWGNEKGLVGIIDMINVNYINEIDLGLNGTNPDNMVFDGTYLYTVNNKDWSGTSISKIDISSNLVTTMDISSISTGCGTSCLRDNKINYQVSGDTELYEWNTQFMPNIGTSMGFSQNFYELAVDNINDYLYTTSTDWISYGMVHIYNSNNILIHSFSCGISPGTIVFDTRNTTNILEEEPIIIKNFSYYDLLGRNSKNTKHNTFYINSKGQKIIRIE